MTANSYQYVFRQFSPPPHVTSLFVMCAAVSLTARLKAAVITTRRICPNRVQYFNTGLKRGLLFEWWLKVACYLGDNVLCANTKSKKTPTTFYRYCSDFFNTLQYSCLPTDPLCAARSNHRMQCDVWQVWASESKTNIFLYFWLNKVLLEKIAFLRRVLQSEIICWVLLECCWIMWWA